MWLGFAVSAQYTASCHNGFDAQSREGGTGRVEKTKITKRTYRRVKSNGRNEVEGIIGYSLVTLALPSFLPSSLRNVRGGSEETTLLILRWSKSISDRLPGRLIFPEAVNSPTDCGPSSDCAVQTGAFERALVKTRPGVCVTTQLRACGSRRRNVTAVQNRGLPR